MPARPLVQPLQQQPPPTVTLKAEESRAAVPPLDHDYSIVRQGGGGPLGGGGEERGVDKATRILVVLSRDPAVASRAIIGSAGGAAHLTLVNTRYVPVPMDVRYGTGPGS